MLKAALITDLLICSIGGDGELSSLLTIPSEWVSVNIRSSPRIIILIIVSVCYWLLLIFTDIIKRYNPDVKGFSVKTGGPNSRNARNNVAVSGGIAL